MTAAPRPVLVLVPLPPTYRGGTEEYAYQVARRVGRERPTRVLTTTVDPTPNSPPIPTDGVPIRRLPARETFQRPWLRRSALRELRRAVAEAGLVHLHMPFPFVERRVVGWARSAGTPVVLTYHMDADLGGASRMPLAGAVTSAYRALSAHPALASASAIVSNSSGYARHSPVLRRHLDRIRVIPKGVDLDRLGLRGPPPPGRAEPGETLLPGSGPSEHRVLFVGRMVPYKGLSVLLEAFARLVPQDPQLTLYLAGKGPERPSLERQAGRLGIAPRVRFLGFVPDDRLAELYRSADVVACPSIGLLESTATTLEEAGALGTPTLGSNLPGASETLADDGVHGLLTPPGDPEAVARGLERLLAQPRPPPPSAGPRSWDAVAADYLGLFDELEGRRAAAPGGRNPDNGGPG